MWPAALHLFYFREIPLELLREVAGLGRALGAGQPPTLGGACVPAWGAGGVGGPCW